MSWVVFVFCRQDDAHTLSHRRQFILYILNLLTPTDTRWRFIFNLPVKRCHAIHTVLPYSPPRHLRLLLFAISRTNTPSEMQIQTQNTNRKQNMCWPLLFFVLHGVEHAQYDHVWMCRRVRVRERKDSSKSLLTSLQNDLVFSCWPESESECLTIISTSTETH